MTVDVLRTSVSTLHELPAAACAGNIAAILAAYSRPGAVERHENGSTLYARLFKGLRLWCVVVTNEVPEPRVQYALTTSACAQGETAIVTQFSVITNPSEVVTALVVTALTEPGTMPSSVVVVWSCHTLTTSASTRSTF